MTTLLSTFIVSLVLSLILTPLAGRLGTRYGALDAPDERKVHIRPLPRTGGLAILATFLLTLIISSFFNTNISNLLGLDRPIIFLLGGATICFGIGLFDDFHRLSPKVKFFFQIIAASVAYLGGIKIYGFDVFGSFFKVGFLSYFITIFWFVLFINAVNLVDGLDGLAGGIVLFASVVMVILAVLREEYLTALLFTALGGSVLGFLRYNFNPATVFLGDGGSYFLGYSIAGLSILGSVKSQLGAAILIPVLALGIPLLDTILSPVRRFVRGKGLFSPDKGHVHHRLLDMGFTAKKAVWLIYLISSVLCIAALIMVNIRDERAGLFLIVLGAGVIIFTSKLGYFEYIASDKIFGWFKDIGDEAGLSHGRRSFLSIQIDISKSKNFEEMWHNITHALEMLEFDSSTFYVNIQKKVGDPNARDRFDRRAIPYSKASVSMRKTPPEWHWARQSFNQKSSVSSRYLLRLELPLLGKDKTNLGTLLLLKDLRLNPLDDFALKRVEHLRRTVINTLEQLENN